VVPITTRTIESQFPVHVGVTEKEEELPINTLLYCKTKDWKFGTGEFWEEEKDPEGWKMIPERVESTISCTTSNSYTTFVNRSAAVTVNETSFELSSEINADELPEVKTAIGSAPPTCTTIPEHELQVGVIENAVERNENA